MMSKIIVKVGFVLLVCLEVLEIQAYSSKEYGEKLFHETNERSIETEQIDDSVLISERDREFLRLKDKYADYIWDGRKFYKIIEGKMKQVEAPENQKEYDYYRQKVLPVSVLAKKYSGWMLTYVIREYAQRFDQLMRERFPNKELTQEEFKICYDPKAERDSLAEVAYMICVTAFGVYNTNQWEKVYQGIQNGSQITLAKSEYENELKKIGEAIRQEIKEK